MKSLRLLLSCLLLLCCFAPFAVAQTTIIDPAGAGGFELGNTFAANGWTVVNNAPVNPTNKWYVGPLLTGFPGNAAYISYDGGTTYGYNGSASSLVHFYRDVTFPAGQIHTTLSFSWKGFGTAFYDGLQVSIAPTTITPATSNSSNGSSGAPLVEGATVLGKPLYYGTSQI